MGSAADTIFASALVVGALVFLVRRFTGQRAHAPACAPDEKAVPQVIVGSTLAKAMAKSRTTH
jgi:hypothetical protein